MRNLINTPILIIAFNRPDVTKQTFEYIRKSKPKKLYIAIDGPREGKDNEELLVNQVKVILQNVDWPCETLYKFNETNKGAEITISSAISWVFEIEEYAIILEDDIVAPLSFLLFAQQMLKKYKDDKRIGTVTGSNFTPIPLPNNTDYFFAKYGHSWGWGTWKRAWEGFNLNIEISNEHLDLGFLKTITNSIAEARHFQKRFRLIKQKGPGNSTWDNVLLYNHRINNRLSVIPRVNLTSNIGIFGLHAQGVSEHHFRNFDESFQVQKHPLEVNYWKEYDIHHFKNYFGVKTSFLMRIIRKIRNLFIKT
jgi:hypothetical protein